MHIALALLGVQLSISGTLLWLGEEGSTKDFGGLMAIIGFLIGVGAVLAAYTREVRQ